MAMNNPLELLFGRQGQFKQAPSQYDPQQQAGFQNLFQQGMQGLGTGNIENLAQSNFRKNTIPLLSERFQRGFGSSGYENIQQGAGNDLETRLAALRQGNANNLLQLGLTPYQGESYYEPGTEGIAGDLTQLAARAGLAYASGGTSELGTGVSAASDIWNRFFGGKKQDIGGQQFGTSQGRKPGMNTFTSPQGVGYSGFNPQELQAQQARQGSLGPLSGGSLGNEIQGSPYDVSKFGPGTGTYGPSELASYISQSGVGQQLLSLLQAGGKSFRGLF